MDIWIAVAFVLVLVFNKEGTCYEQPLILWTQQSHYWSKIRGVMGDPDEWVTGEKRHPYVQSESIRNTFRYALTYNPATNEIMWSDIIENRILRQDLPSSLDKRTDNVVEIFHQDGAQVSSLAVDWLTGNSYFIERTGKFIAVQSLKNYENNLYKILFKSSVKNPTSLAVDPYKGLLFWSDQEKGTIESSTTKGTSQTTLVNGLWKPLGIALDVEEEKIYYLDADARTINKVNYDGTGREQIFQGGKDRTYFEIAVLGNYIFVTTGENLQVDVHKKSTGEHIRSADIDAAIYHIVSVQTYDLPPHECDSKRCEHICLNTGPDMKAECLCATGYTIHEDGVTCMETSPSYITSRDKSIILSQAFIDGKGSNTQLTLSHKVLREGATEARAVGVHYEKKYVYYSDLGTDMIYWGDVTGTWWKELTAGTRHVEGIAVDWTSNILFWSDKVLEHIMCSQLTGHFHRIHIQNIRQPKDLVIDYVKKRLIWTSNHNGHPKIEAVGINGMGRQVILQEPTGVSGEFKGITVDPVTERIYWSNRGQGVIESIDLNGQQRKTVTAGQQFDMYGVGIYGDYLTYTRSSGNSIQFYDVRDNYDISNVINEWLPSVKDEISSSNGYYDVAVFESYMQPQETNLCKNNNGGCQHLCFPNSMSARSCGCAIGYTLNSNGYQCDSDTTDSHFVLFVDPYHKQIYQIQTGAAGSSMATSQGIPVPRMQFPISLDYDIAERKVYWIDRDTLEIKSSDLDGGNAKLVHSLPKESQPKRLAIDPVGRYVFYTDTSDRALHRIEIESGHHSIHVANVVNPLALAVDYNQAKVYWTNGGMLERCNVDGTIHRETLFTRNELFTGIALTNGHIYICVWENGIIFDMDLNSTSLKAVQMVTLGLEIYGLAADSNYIYYTKWNEKGVYRINRKDGLGSILLDHDIFARITDIRAVEDLIPMPVVPINHVIVIAGAAAGALFLLALLACIFALLACRRCKNDDTKSSSEDSSSGFDSGDRDAEYMMYSNGTVFDTRSSNKSAGNNTPTKDSISTDSGISGLSAQSGTDLIQRSPDLSNINGVNNPCFIREGSGIGGGGGSNNNGNGAVPVLPILGAPVAPKRYTKKEQFSHKRIKHKHQPDPNEFNLREDKKVATIIQRLATRLRKRLSSVRYDDPQPRPGIHTNNPPSVGVDIEGYVDPLRNYNEKKKMPPNKRNIHIPNKLHKEPRGWAPASHNVPRVFKSSLGRAKGQEVNISQ